MKIKSIRSWRLRAELEQPFAFSQWQFRRRDTTLVRVESDYGVHGWGEGYGPSAAIASAVDDLFSPLLAGRDPRDTESLWELMYARSIDYGQKGTMVAAISALDIALWDLKGKALGLPVYRLLGGEHTESVPCYATGFYFYEDQQRHIEQEAQRYRDLGFGAAKMKVGRGVAADAQSVAMVRRALGPELRLMIDANHAYTPVEAIALGRRVEEHGIYWFEEPVSPLDLDGYLEVKRALRISIAGGECEATRFGFEPWLRRRALDFAQPDLCSAGGISEGMKIAALASVHNTHVTPHAWGSAVGQAAALHFYAARPRQPFTLTREDKLIECDHTESPFRTAIVERPVEFRQGAWLLPQTPGLGVDVREEALERFQVKS